MSKILPGVAEIGNGYDVITGLYADSVSCSRSLFDFSAGGETAYQIRADGENFVVPKDITVHTISETTYTTSFGETIQKYTQSLNSKTSLSGSYSFFSGSLSVDFNSNTTSNSNYAYTRTQQDVSLYTLVLPAISTLKTRLTESAKNDIATLDPTRLFDSYGTHFLNKLVAGGRAVYASSTSKLSFESSYSIEVVANAAYQSLTGTISAENKTKYASDISNFNSSSNTTVTTRGGDTKYGGDQLPTHLQDWANSVAQYPVLVDFVDSQSLLPLWDLAADDARSKVLSDAYPAYLAARANPLIVHDGPFLYAMTVPVDVQVSADHGSGAKMDLSTWKPEVGADWYYLGPVAVSGYSLPATQTVVVKEIVPGALGKIDHWNYVWNDAGSGKNSDYSLWQGVATNPQDYRVLGDFFRGPASNQNAPDVNEAANIRAVYRDCLQPGKVGSQVWTDHGTGADRDGSVWQIVASSSANSTEPHTFVAALGWDAPNNRQLFVLKSDALVWVNVGRVSTSSEAAKLSVNAKFSHSLNFKAT